MVLLVMFGNSTFPDPMERLARALSPNIPFIALSQINFVDPLLAPTLFSWQTFFSLLPQLTYFEMRYATWLGAALPTQLPHLFEYFAVSDSGLTGTLPGSFFNDYVNSPLISLLEVDFSNNLMTGGIPDLWLNGLSQVPELAQLTITMNLNRFDGSISPSAFNGAFADLEQFSLELSNCALTGPLAGVFNANTFSASQLTTVILSLGQNRLTGSLPTDWFSSSALAGVSYFHIYADENMLSGTIPADLISSLGFSTSSPSIIFSYDSNQLTGTLPSNLLDLQGRSVLELRLEFPHNQLNGTIDANFFSRFKWDTPTSFGFMVANNSLEGSLPSTLTGLQTMQRLVNLDMSFSDNQLLTGSIPSGFLNSLVPSIPVTSTVQTVFNFNADRCRLSGALAFPNLELRAQPLKLSFSATDNLFTSLSFEPGSEIGIVDLSLASNPLLTGTLPDFIFNFTTSLFFGLNLSRTEMSGDLPDMQTLNTRIRTLDLSHTNINFCTEGRMAWASINLQKCVLNSTNAYMCSSLYSSRCTVSAPEEVPVAIPQAVPSTPPSGCSIATRPSTAFVCIDGTWTFQGTLNTTVLTIPSGATQTVILGNVTSTSVVINGLGSTIVVYGCATNLSLITVELTPEELKQIGSTGRTQTLISTDPSQCSSTSLGTVAVATHVTGKTCRKVSTKTIESGGTVSGLFVVSSSGCNVWWIILVAVVGGVLILAAAIAVAITCVQKQRVKKESIRLHG